ncbi:MAG: von Willebrand factor type A domain-containing protein [Longimicrobiales bacterium]|nr:von Willebrand factor type A domain-containing protein [Longimicrobiales bacterium]
MLSRILALASASALLVPASLSEAVDGAALHPGEGAFTGAVHAPDAGAAAEAPGRVAAPRAVEIVGRITDAASGQGIRGAQVFVSEAGVGALTNAFGRYLLRLDARWIGRDVTVEVQSMGYAPLQQTVTVRADLEALDFSLHPAPLGRDEVGRPEWAVRASEAVDVASPVRLSSLAVPGGRRPFPPGPPPTDREAYAHIAENAFVSVESNPLSTFSIDVDRASYANVRRFIEDGMRPPIDAVRIEELINYFPYDDPPPAGDVPFAVTAETAPAPWQPLHQLVRIGVKGREIDMEEAPANNLVFLLDVSGSMSAPDKLPLLKRAFSMLVDELRPQDRVAIVVYAGAAGLVLPPTPGSERATILEAIGRLEAGGSTAGGAGIRLAYRVAAESRIEGGNNRVLLATDGDFNVGASSDAEMIRLIEEKRRQGTFLTVLGFGTGNLQDAKMEQIADHGNGNFSYIDSALEARKVLVDEMGGTLLTIAKDVKIQVEFNPARVAAYRLIGYENRLLAAEDFNDDTKDAGELGAGHSVTALYEIVPPGVETTAEIRDVDPLRYQRNTDTRVLDNEEMLFVKLRYKDPDGDTSRLVTRKVGDTVAETSDDFRFSAAVAAWGMLLRDSEHCDGFTLDDVARLARGALGDDPRGYRTDFLRLLDRARGMEILAMEPGLR